MRDKLIDDVSEKFNIKQKYFLEKDIILHEIMSSLCSDEYFSSNFIFKGGTCLVKSYLRYHRFSEDLDFTWKNQDAFRDDQKRSVVEKVTSSEAEKLGEIFQSIATKFELEFKNEKKNTEYFQFSGGGTMLTLFMWYDSKIVKERSMVKIQFNFVEKVCYKPEIRELSSIVPGDKSLQYVYGGHPYFEKLKFPVYEPREILCEKIRAILTRRGIKARDFLDIFLVCEAFGIKLSDIEENAIEKINHSTENNEKYRNNLEDKLELLNSEEFFAWGDEGNLLLREIEEEKFTEFEKELETFLKESIIPNLKRT